jgi:hypothetical protein
MNGWRIYLKLPRNKLIQSSVNPVKLAKNQRSFGLRAYGPVEEDPKYRFRVVIEFVPPWGIGG